MFFEIYSQARRSAETICRPIKSGPISSHDRNQCFAGWIIRLAKVEYFSANVIATSNASYLLIFFTFERHLDRL